jgi:hypothetical protein
LVLVGEQIAKRGQLGSVLVSAWEQPHDVFHGPQPNFVEIRGKPRPYALEKLDVGFEGARTGYRRIRHQLRF